jgi:polysaccharide export outer membrane protein
VAEPAGNQVHVMGEVRTPGSYPAVPFVTLSEAIVRAGGFADDANRNDVLIFHRDGASTVRVSRVALGRGLKHGSLADDVLLDRFDIVYVPRSAIGNVDVFVRQYFAETQAVLTTALAGWELFNLDRVFSPVLVQKR